MALSASEISQALGQLRVDTSGSENLQSRLAETKALLQAIKQLLLSLGEGLRQIIANAIAEINRELLVWLRRLERIAAGLSSNRDCPAGAEGQL